MAIQIIVPTTNCPLTGLRRVRRYTSHTVNANESISVNYAIDTLDIQGNVYKVESEHESIHHHSTAINNGSEVIEPGEMAPEMAALITAEKSKLTAILTNLNIPE